MNQVANEDPVRHAATDPTLLVRPSESTIGEYHRRVPSESTIPALLIQNTVCMLFVNFLNLFLDFPSLVLAELNGENAMHSAIAKDPRLLNIGGLQAARFLEVQDSSTEKSQRAFNLKRSA